MNKDRGGFVRQKDFLFLLIGFMIAAVLLTLIRGEMQWPILIGGLIGVVGAELIRRLRSKGQQEDSEVEYDERINDYMKTWIINLMGISHLLLLIALIVIQSVFKQPAVKVEYVILYLLVTLIVAFFLIPSVARRK
ncbi:MULTISPECIES: hypothetical protein [Geobacillus]|uniref:Uncharacterized protein n=1 Tax=Geobacillus thermocatenulatus TaxID=33938 RepID=A0A226Q317_9BACL|nr:MULTISPECIES: hypothetical protein [Geobacillus]AST00369.1 hypothetical protein GT3921_15845 [Geobacillus thermocatenulatus]KLR72373.1 hypothetical protein ABH20_16690 [Geobacillus sp. T6]OXB86741.1 hypothetical protein B9L19_14715 [Geobacillus thermocatenulatus]RAN30134.1 hypothetical protein VC88_03865 [Geobacillus sp. A8]